MVNIDGNDGAHGALGKSTKEIARAAVEAEFRNKKKKRKRGHGGGGGYASSSSDEGDNDDDDGDRKKDKRNKKCPGKKDSSAVEEDDKEQRAAFEADLATRYRDRAAERRDGKMEDDDGDGDTTKTSSEEKTVSSTSLIIPHNKKGLDLSLARLAKKKIQEDKESNDGGPTGAISLSGRSTSKKGTAVDDGETIMSILDRSGPHILKHFVSKDPADHMDAYTAIVRNRGIMDYLKVIVRYIEEEQEIEIHNPTFTNSTTATTNGRTAHKNSQNDDDDDDDGGENNTSEESKKRTLSETLARITDAVEFGAAGRTLQHTQWVLALDGHPSDRPQKAWQVPRQEIRSSSSFTGTSNTGSSTLQLSSDVIDGIDRIFRARNRLLSDMKKRHITIDDNASCTTQRDVNDSALEASKSVPTGARSSNGTNRVDKIEEEDDDDDIFDLSD